jgi:predicted enzyme related to lactoylglutathione lyase
MSDGRRPEPGGWNRIIVRSSNLDNEVAALKEAGVAVRNDIVAGPGGRQILLEDPSGNLVELFEPAPDSEK